MKKEKNIPIISDVYYTTFSCSSDIHTYSKNSNVSPNPPYTLHNSLEEAKKYKPNGKIVPLSKY